MASLPNAENRDVHAMTHYLKWSQTEKRIARKAFERALDREFQAVIHTAKEMAAKIEQPADLWDLESYLTQSRKAIDRKYDYRHSVLTFNYWYTVVRNPTRQIPFFMCAKRGEVALRPVIFLLPTVSNEASLWVPRRS